MKSAKSAERKCEKEENDAARSSSPWRSSECFLPSTANTATTNIAITAIAFKANDFY